MLIADANGIEAESAQERKDLKKKNQNNLLLLRFLRGKKIPNSGTPRVQILMTTYPGSQAQKSVVLLMKRRRRRERESGD